MTVDGYIVVGGIALMIAALVRDLLRPGLVLFSLLVLFISLGIITSEEGIAGFSNKGMLTVGILFLVSEGVRKTGTLNYIARVALPRQKQALPLLLGKMMLPVSFLSAFLNNTPVVIIFAPIIKKWSEKLGLPASKFLIPLSYATIFGGICTLVGTSTNLVVHGLMLDNGMKGIGMFELAKAGIFVGGIGFIYVILIGNEMLPWGRIDAKNIGYPFREYVYDCIIPERSNLNGKQVKNGHLEELKDYTISEIRRDGKVFHTADSIIQIQERDNLILAGKSTGLEGLMSIDGISLSSMKEINQSFRQKELKQVETVLAPRFPGIGKTLKEFNFFSHYGAVVVAVHRNGEQLVSNLDQVILKPGDNLILLTTEQFEKDWGESRVFYMMSAIGAIDNGGKNIPFDWKKWAALIIVIFMITGAALSSGWSENDGNHFDMFFFAALATVVMVWLKIIPAANYPRSVSWDVLITIACAFGLAKAMQNSGAADAIAHGAIGLVKNQGPLAVLAAVYLITTIFTEVITNNAAAALVFPIAIAAAQQLGVDPRPFTITICIAASASFSTPIGYQTNLIVQGLGNYRFKDYVRIGLPLNIIAFAVSMLVIPKFWPF